MGTIIERKSKTGGKRYTAQIRLKHEGKIVVSEAKTFAQRRMALGWLKRKEVLVEEAGGALAFSLGEKSAAAQSVTGVDVIDAYLKSLRKTPGKTKLGYLEMLKRFDIAQRDWRTLTTTDFITFGSDLLKGVQPAPKDLNKATAETFELKARQPQTVGNILAHLKTVLEYAGPIIGHKLPTADFHEAMKNMRHTGTICRSRERTRRPTLQELDMLLDYFHKRFLNDPRCVPMHMVIHNQIFGCNRLGECARATWDDYNSDDEEQVIKNMKHPRKTDGNDVTVKVREEQRLVIDAMPRTSDRIFPYHKDTMSRLFTEACQLLDIKDLHFHDLRHEGISRLFEMSLTIPEVAAVSGHKSWQLLSRYTHLKKKGDKFEGWIWIERLREGKL